MTSRKLNSSRENQSLLSLRRGVLKAKPTAAELHVKRLLDEIGERYCFQKGFYTYDRHYIVDFYLPKRKKLCLEVDGGYHSSAEQMAYDERRDSFLTNERGFRVKRIRNENALAMDASAIIAFIS